MAKTSIKEIPDETWRKFKMLCIKRQTRLNDELVGIIESRVKYLEAIDARNVKREARKK